MKCNSSYKVVEYNVYGKKSAINSAEASVCPCCRSKDINVSLDKEKKYYFFRYLCSECKTIWQGNLYTSKWEYVNNRRNPHYKIICANPEGRRRAVRKSEAEKCPTCHGKYIEGCIRRKNNSQRYIYICSDCGTKWLGELYDMYWHKKGKKKLIHTIIKMFSIIAVILVVYHISM